MHIPNTWSLTSARNNSKQKFQPFLFSQLHFNNVTSHTLFYGGHLVMCSKRCAVQNQGITLSNSHFDVIKNVTKLCCLYCHLWPMTSNVILPPQTQPPLWKTQILHQPLYCMQDCKMVEPNLTGLPKKKKTKQKTKNKTKKKQKYIYISIII